MSNSKHVADRSIRGKVAEIMERIAAEGGRRTASRHAVVRAIVQCHGHITVDQIVETVQRHLPSVDVSTVYRTVEMLRELDIVERVHIGYGRAVYHLVDHEHHHLYCRECGEVRELPSSALAQLSQTIETDFGFVLDQRPVSFAGLCEKCSDR